MIVRAVPMSFILPRHQISREEIALGLKEGWLDRSDVQQSLAGGLRLSESDVMESDEESAQSVRLTWLRILLAWIFENRASITSPFTLIEQLYAGFGYPEEIYNLVSFNPPKDGYRPQDHSREQNQARLLRLWEAYCARHMGVKR